MVRRSWRVRRRRRRFRCFSSLSMKRAGMFSGRFGRDVLVRCDMLDCYGAMKIRDGCMCRCWHESRTDLTIELQKSDLTRHFALLCNRLHTTPLD